MAEVIVYQAEDSSYISLPVIDYGEREVLPGFLSKLARALALIGVAVIIFSYAPSFWYTTLASLGTKVASIRLSQKEVQLLSAKGRSAEGFQVPSPSYLPPLNSALPIESR